MKKNLKLYTVRKYIWAETAKQALSKEKNAHVDDIWVDDDWKKASREPKDAIGFYAPPE